MSLILLAVPGAPLYWVRVFNGLGDCFITVCAYPYITSLVEGEAKNSVYAFLFSVSMLAQFLGNIAAGSLVTQGQSYETVILLSAGMMAVVTGLRCLLPRTTFPSKSGFKLYFPKNKLIRCYFIYEVLGYVSYFLAYAMLNIIFRE